MRTRKFYNDVRTYVNANNLSEKGKKVLDIYKELKNNQPSDTVVCALLDYIANNITNSEYVKQVMATETTEEAFMKRIFVCDELVEDCVIHNIRDKALDFLHETMPERPSLAKMQNNLVDDWHYQVKNDGPILTANIISYVGFFIGNEPYDAGYLSETENFGFAKNVLETFVKNKLQEELNAIFINHNILSKQQKPDIINVSRAVGSKTMVAIPVIW